MCRVFILQNVTLEAKHHYGRIRLFHEIWTPCSGTHEENCGWAQQVPGVNVCDYINTKQVCCRRPGLLCKCLCGLNMQKKKERSLTNHNSILFLIPSLMTKPVSWLGRLCFSPTYCMLIAQICSSKENPPLNNLILLQNNYRLYIPCLLVYYFNSYSHLRASHPGETVAFRFRKWVEVWVSKAFRGGICEGNWTLVHLMFL